MTRELKLALIVGFSLVLVVTVLVSDHFSRARKSQLASPATEGSRLAVNPERPLRPDEPTAQLPPSRPISAAPLGILPDDGRTNENTGTGGLSGRGEDLAGTTPDAPVRQDPVEIPLGSPRVADAGSADPDSSLIAEALRQGWQAVRRDGELVFIPAVRPEASPLPRESDGGAKPLGQDAIERLNSTREAARDARKSGQLVADGSHVVAKGEALGKIARTYYGKESYWKKLAAYNGLGADGGVREGARLKIPPVEVLEGGARPLAGAPASALATNSAASKAKAPEVKPEVAKPAKPETKPSPREYVVAKGDTLGKIAAKFLGSSSRAGELVALNDLEDEDMVMVGTKLRLPPTN